MVDFPKDDDYSNKHIKIEKNLIKNLRRIKEEKKELTDRLFFLEKQCYSFEKPNNVKIRFKEIRNKMNNNIKSLPEGSDKDFPENKLGIRSKRIGECESCLHRQGLHKSHIIQEKVFKNHLLRRYSFLNFHPLNILFLCENCHKKFDGRGLNNKGEKVFLSNAQIKRVDAVLRKRIKNIRKAIKSDEKYLKNYKKSIDTFDAQKRKMLSRLLKHL